MLSLTAPRPSRTFASLAADLRSRPPRLGRVRLVCVDGPAGSGKTSFASTLSAALGGARVVHLDDLYEGWSGLEGVAERLVDQVLAPLAAGKPGRHQRYSWEQERFAEWHDVPVATELVVEGCGSADRVVDDLAVLRVWVEAPPSVRLARGLDRDGEALRHEWLRWSELEVAHFVRERTRARSDLLVDGDPPVRPAGGAFTLLPG